MNDVLDEIDRAILTCLTQDARVSLKVLSARGADSPSTAERVKRPRSVSFRAMGAGKSRRAGL